MNLMEGKVVSQTVLTELAGKLTFFKEKHNLVPGIAVVIIGDDPASQVYVRNKVRSAKEVGLYSELHELPETTTQAEVLALVHKLNADPLISGILVQFPPPAHIDERSIIEAIAVEKDVDCFHPYNVGKLLIGDVDGFLPCTPQGVMTLLDYYQVPTQGRHAVVLGRSNLVGKPLAALLARKSEKADCTVTLCHSRTRDLESICIQADILIAAIGRPRFVKASMVKPGAVVIDVGINRIPDSSRKSGERLVGDVDFDTVAPIASLITPVPGGVGPMTIAMLFRNVVTACSIQHKIRW